MPIIVRVIYVIGLLSAGSPIVMMPLAIGVTLTLPWPSGLGRDSSEKEFGLICQDYIEALSM